jgi:hypothetical protein
MTHTRPDQVRTGPTLAERYPKNPACVPAVGMAARCFGTVVTVAYPYSSERAAPPVTGVMRPANSLIRRAFGRNSESRYGRMACPVIVTVPAQWFGGPPTDRIFDLDLLEADEALYVIHGRYDDSGSV